MVGLTINLISKTHNLCEMREYTFMALQKYAIIFHPTVRMLLFIQKKKKKLLFN